MDKDSLARLAVDMCIGKFIDMYEKKGRSGPLAFTVFENRYTNQDGDLVAIERVTGIYR